MKKWAIGIFVTLVLLGTGAYAGYHYLINMAADKISEELSEQILEDPQLSKEMERLAGEVKTEEAITPLKDPTTGKAATNPTAAAAVTKPVQEVTTSGNNNSGSTPVEHKDQDAQKRFNSKEEAVRFAMSRFSASEINHIRKLVSGGITSEEKKELKAIAYSKFSFSEIEAVRQAVSQ